jgi:3-keto-disaccharide hydrolase
LVLGSALLIAGVALGAGNPFAGRWDITVTEPNATYPGWMQLSESNGKTEVMVQPRSGHALMTKFSMEGSRLHVIVFEPRGDSPGSTWDLTVSGGKLSGTQTMGDRKGQIVGVPAPKLDRPAPAAWSQPEPIFNGKDLGGWEPFGGNHATNHWSASDGVLVNAEGGANLRTKRKFEDFKLHVEFSCPDEGNSGIYLRGRYEVQIACGSEEIENPVQALGAVYGYLAPSVQKQTKAGEWETYDITLVGRTVTVALNGVKIIDGKEIPGVTGGALDSMEGQPGPFYIQGDHTGGIRFRNITVAVPKS